MRPIRPVGSTRTPIDPVRTLTRYREEADTYETIRAYHERSAAARSKIQGKPAGSGSSSGSDAVGRKGSHRTGMPSLPYGQQADLDAAEQAARQIASVLAAIQMLKAPLYALNSDRIGSAWSSRSVISSEVLSVNGTASPHASISRWVVDVRRIAVSQLNTSASFEPEAPTNIRHGDAVIRIEAPTGEHATAALWIDSEDTHRMAMYKLRTALQACGFGVSVKLETDARMGRIRIACQSDRSGRMGAFTLEDITGNACSASGLRVVDRKAEDAEYRIENRASTITGMWRHAGTNEIILEQAGLTVHLHRVTQEPVILAVQADLALLLGQFRSLAGACSLLHHEISRASGLLNPTIARSFAHLLADPTLPAYGFGSSENGGGLRLAAPHTLQARLQDAPAETMAGLAADPASFLRRLRRFVDRIEGAPADALLDRANRSFQRYANYLATLERYSQLPTQGLLLNEFL